MDDVGTDHASTKVQEPRVRYSVGLNLLRVLICLFSLLLAILIILW